MNKNFIFIIKIIIAINCPSFLHSIEYNTTKCLCDYNELIEIEKLNVEYKRIRIDKSNGTQKYHFSELNSTTKIECRSIVLYEVMNDIDLKSGKARKKCRTCTRIGWSDIKTCNLIRCDGDALIGKPILKQLYNNEFPDDIKLFTPGQVIAEYKFGDTNLCKECQKEGEWSKFSDSSICKELTTPKPKSDCKYDTLKEIEYNQLDYVRVRIESADGLYKIDQDHILDNNLAHKTVVVYQRYLSNLPNAVNRLTELDLNYYSFNVFTKKFCRYCDDGVWSDLESCISLSCDREILSGIPDILSIPKYNKIPDKQTLIKPYSAIAQYSFGSNNKFCKQCHENGEWTKYSLAELCDIKTFDIFKKSSDNIPHSNRANLAKSRINIQQRDMYKKEITCDYESLISLEKEYDDMNRVMIVSSDRKSKLNPAQDAKLPSRTLSIYQKKDKTSSRHFCSICINGIWSQISSDCVSDTSLYFCEKEKLRDLNSAVFKLKDDELLNEKQNLFQPGSVMVVYDISETTRLCKICSLKGDQADWSKYSETQYCNPSIAFSKINQRIRSLQNPENGGYFCLRKQVESKLNDEFQLESVQSWDGKHEFDSTLELVPEQSIAIYSSSSTDIQISSLKWCKKCSSTKWDDGYSACPIEFSIKKCDPNKLMGVDYFVYAADGSKLDSEESSNLVIPGQVFAVYEFGPQKYCKNCENGQWSSYPQYNLCHLINWN